MHPTSLCQVAQRRKHMRAAGRVCCQPLRAVFSAPNAIIHNNKLFQSQLHFLRALLALPQGSTGLPGSLLRHQQRPGQRAGGPGVPVRPRLPAHRQSCSPALHASHAISLEPRCTATWQARVPGMSDACLAPLNLPRVLPLPAMYAQL